MDSTIQFISCVGITIKPKVSMELFRAEAIIKNFPRSSFKLAIPSICLTAGSITGVVGENGNGKTTFLNIVAGESDGEGDYYYFGNKVDRKSNWTVLKNNIGFIPQRIPKWYGTLEQNLYLKAALEGVDASEIDQKLDELLDFLDLQKYRKLKWTEISTGYRLRFELARVLLGSPRLLVLDEPLANLDINTQQKFLSDLKILLAKRDEPLAITLSSQQLHEIESVATQMLFLRKGEAVFSGSIHEISSEEEFNLFEMQLSDTDFIKIEELYTDSDVIKKVGPYLQLSTSKSTSEVLHELLGLGVEVKYFRDLSKSTKRFFN